MTWMFCWVVAPVVLSLLVWLGTRVVRNKPLFCGSLLAGVYLAASISLLFVVAQNETLTVSFPWVSELGMDLEFRMTSFSAWFGALVFGLGASILLYAAAYFKDHERLPFLLACLLLFTASMLGVIWSDNLYLLFLFWEATSLLSFLLVGFHHEKEDTRGKAAQALLVTFFGGAAMLAGFVLLHVETGESTLSGLLEFSATNDFTHTVALVLIVMGALTKSAQFPFHFWLPNAMAGPTPVSAYLHSATMVKAGVFLLASLAPALANHPWWTPLLVTSGLLTVFTAVKRAWNEDDLKGILASTTLAALGFLTVLAGVGSPLALQAFVIFLTAHALYKAPLFLSAGNLEKHFGSRRLTKLRGAIHRAPVTGAIIVISLISLLGLPPLAGFLGKEYLLKSLWAESPWIAVVTALAASGVICIGLRLLISLLARDHVATIKRPIPKMMTIAALWPAMVTLLLMALHPWINETLFAPSAMALGNEPTTGFSYWHGWTPALGLGLGAIIIATATVMFFTRPRMTHETNPNPPDSVFEGGYHFVVEMITQSGKACGRLLERGTLPVHLALILSSVGFLSILSVNLASWPSFVSLDFEHTIIFVLITPALAIAAFIAARTNKPLTILVSLGFVGLIIAFIFLWLSAPDLALTQLLAETLIILLITGVLLKFKPATKPNLPPFLRLFIASGATVLVTMLILKAMSIEWDHPVSEYYQTHSKSAAYGANVVNVILVDFRALDTLGEIVVLAIAAIGANAALGAARRRAPLPGSLDTVWMQAAFPLLASILVVAAIWIFWRGHNAPGGGFIAALMLASAVSLGLLVARPELNPRTMRKFSRGLLLGGLGVSLFSALLPVFFGQPFFTGLWWHRGDLHLGTPLLFDLGVSLTVTGFALSYLRHFHLITLSPCKFS